MGCPEDGMSFEKHGVWLVESVLLAWDPQARALGIAELTLDWMDPVQVNGAMLPWLRGPSFVGGKSHRDVHK